MFKIPVYTLTDKKLLITALITGLLLGAAAVFGYKISNSVEIFMSQFGLYVILPVVIGYLSSKPKKAVLASTIVLVAMNLVYYLPYSPTLLTYVFSLIPFTALALMAGPAFGYSGYLLRQPTPRSKVAFGLVAGLVFGELIRITQVGISHGTVGLYIISIAFDLSALVALFLLIKPNKLMSTLAYVLFFTLIGYLITLILT